MVKYKMFHPESDYVFIADTEKEMKHSLAQGCSIVEEDVE